MSPEAPLFIRLYLDEDVHRRMASALRLRHFDVVSAHEVRRWGLSDEEQLSYAASEGRALFTYNAADYLQLHLDWLQRGQEHQGIIVSDQLPIGETVRRLLSLLNRVTADEMRNELRWLEAFRRVR
ncbi:MAG: DUF5615 family PIN-like protein [Anaerolineae bacterium]